MRLLNQIFSKDTAGPDILRLAVCAILITHGGYRIYLGEVGGLGDLLKEEGVPLGLLLAWLISLGETVGSILVALRILAAPIALIQAAVPFTGIMMFNRHRGFFVIGGHANNGWEYNALIVVCLLVTAWENRGRLFNRA